MYNILEIKNKDIFSLNCPLFYAYYFCKSIYVQSNLIKGLAIKCNEGTKDIKKYSNTKR